MSAPSMSAHFAGRRPSVIRAAQIEYLKRTDGVKDLNVAIGNVSLPMHPVMQERMRTLGDAGSPFAGGVVQYSLTKGERWANDAFLNIIASSGFLATAASVGALRHRFGRILFAGLVLSLCGDLFLIGQSQRFFLFGLASFLLAHIAYITAFVSYGQSRNWVLVVAAPAVAAAVGIGAWLEPHVSSSLAAPVHVYTAAITLMVITAFGARGSGAPRIIVAGALMFLVSDLSVAMQRIIETDFPTIIWGLPLYYAGQICLALGAAPEDR